MNLHVKLICLRRKIGISFNIRVHSNLFFILVTYLIWHWAKGNPFFKKSNFPLSMGCFIIWCLAFNQSTGILSYFMSRKLLRWACLTSQKWKHSASPERGPEWPLQMMASRGSNWKVKLKTIKTLEKLFCITNRHYLKKNQHNKFKITGWVLSVPAHLFTFWSLRKFWKNVLGREALSASTMAAVCSTLQMFSRFFTE